LVVVGIVFLEHFLVAAEVLADHFKIGTFFAVLLEIVVFDLGVAATGGVLAFDG
jgi:hypothetical protein